MFTASDQEIQVLHVDDEPNFADLTTAFLEREGDRFAVETATSADEGRERISDQPPDCVVSDYNMPGMDGLEFLQAVREEYPDLSFILFTGKGSEAVVSDVISAGVTDYLQKGSGSEQYELLANRIENAVTSRRSQQMAQQRKERLELFFEESPLGSIQWDNEFRFKRLNARAEELLGYEETELRGESWETIVAESDREQVAETVEDLLDSGGGRHVHNRNRKKDGEIISSEWHNRVVTDADGTVRSIFSKFQDVTERESRKRELKQYGAIIDALTDAVYVVDEEGRFTYVNEEFVELVGYDRETILGNTPSLIKDAAAVEEAGHQLGRLLSSDGPDAVAFDVMIQPRDGDPIVCEDHMGVLPYEGDQFDGSVGTLRDITDRKERQQELAQTHDLMTNMEELADVGAWEYDPDTETLVMTAGASRIHGLEPDADLSLEEVFSNFHPDDRDLLRNRFDTCLDTGEPYDIDVRLTTPDGRQRWITVRGERVTMDGNGSVLRGYIQDITEQRSRERNLERYRTALNELPDPVIVYDKNGRYNILNDAATKIRDVPNEDLMGTKSPYLEQIREENPTEYDKLLEGRRDTLQVELTAEFSGLGTRTHECRLSRMTDGADSDGIVIVTRDITDRKERERQLNRERERYATLFGTLPNPVLHARAEDDEPVVETVNPAFEDTFGYDTETIRNEPIQEYVLPDDQDDAAHQLNKQVLNEGEVQTEVQRQTTDGVRTFRLNVRTSDTDGESVDGYAVYTDVTEQKQLERDLRQERDLVEGIIETSPVGIAVVTADGDLSFVNDRAERIYGQSRDEIKEMSHDDPRWDLVNERGSPIEADDVLFGHVVSQEAPVRDQIVGIRRPSGERIWLSVSGAPQYDDDGELERAVFAFKDITEQRKLEAELSEILGRVSDAFFALDGEFKFTHINGRAEELLQASEDELLGETVWDIYPEAAETDKIRDAFHAAMETQEPQSLELYYEPLEFWVEASVYPSESGISVYFQDVTEQKKYEQELEAQNERLEEFTSVVSHDLYNPLTVADGRLELAQEVCECPHLDQAADAIDRSQALIEDLLTLAREGEDMSEVEPVGLADMAESCWQTVESQPAVLETHAARTLQVDQSRLKQLFENLYRNAIEHSGDNVTVSVGQIDDGFYVADTGPGIPEDDREEVFEAGYSTKEKGTGFGLRIVRQVANAHGWEVAVTESEQGGARFEVTGVEFADK